MPDCLEEKRTTGGREGAEEATSFSTPLRFATWNCCGLSNAVQPLRHMRISTAPCVKPTPESILGDVSGLDIQAAINLSLATERVGCSFARFIAASETCPQVYSSWRYLFDIFSINFVQSWGILPE